MPVRPPGISGRVALVGAALFTACSQLVAGVPGTLPNHGFQWSTVTHAGNAPITLNANTIPPTPVPVGQVNQNYRIMTTEVTIGQWFEFVQAYARFAPTEAANDPAFRGSNGIFFTGFVSGVPTYVLNTTIQNQPVRAGWRYGARLANWLHNGKPGAGVATAADFESGAYDTTTFATVPLPGGGSYITDQAARSQGARFFFPTYDEWVKAAYWDPNRFGPDQPGYWQYPITSDTAPIPDSPQFGGQTNTGPFPPGQTRPLDVGSYPDAQSPWGVLDLSGGAREWLENLGNFYNFVPGALTSQRYVLGSDFAIFANPAISDILHAPDGVGAFPDFTRGIRLASLVPSPGSIVAVCLPAFILASRRRVA